MTDPTTGPRVLPTDDVDAPGRLALVEAFVNTYDLELDDEVFTDAQALQAWLRERQLLTGQLTDTDLDRAVELREALRAFLQANHDGAPPPAGAVAVVERASARAPLVLDFHDAHATIVPRATGLDEAIAWLLAIMYDAMRDGSWDRLKRCGNDECAVAFFDASRNRSGRWCSMAVCGNRAKVAKFRQRHPDA